MGGALGGLESLFFLPHLGLGFWPLVSMGAILGGTMRSPFTGIIFMLELTHDVNMLLPLFIAVIVSYTVTVLVMRRSILTEKVSRRGYHLSREYAVDPLETILVRDAMRTHVEALPEVVSRQDLADMLAGHLDGHEAHQQDGRRQSLYPVLDGEGALRGVVTRKDLHHLQQEQLRTLAVVRATEISVPPSEPYDHEISLTGIHPHPVVAYASEPLRATVYRMAETGYTRLPVVEQSQPDRLLGMISLSDLLKARRHHLEEERHRDRPLQIAFLYRKPSREKVKQIQA